VDSRKLGKNSPFYLSSGKYYTKGFFVATPISFSDKKWHEGGHSGIAMILPSPPLWHVTDVEKLTVQRLHVSCRDTIGYDSEVGRREWFDNRAIQSGPLWCCQNGVLFHIDFSVSWSCITKSIPWPLPPLMQVPQAKSMKHIYREANQVTDSPARKCSNSWIDCNSALLWIFYLCGSFGWISELYLEVLSIFFLHVPP